MKCYGRNRARVLGQKPDVQPEVTVAYGTTLRCPRCKRVQPVSEFEDGRFKTCETCRARERENRRQR